MSRAVPTKPAPSEPGRPLHEADLYAWAIEQARLLREGCLDLIDAENLAEEIADVGEREYDKLESALTILLQHMLACDYRPERRSRSWENAIAIQRRHIERQLRDNPSLQARLAAAIEEAYVYARLRASSETDMDVERFPETCPYDWEDITGRSFERDRSP